MITANFASLQLGLIMWTAIAQTLKRFTIFQVWYVASYGKVSADLKRVYRELVMTRATGMKNTSEILQTALGS